MLGAEVIRIRGGLEPREARVPRETRDARRWWAACWAGGAAAMLLASCAGNRVTVRTSGRIVLDRGQPVAQDAPLVATFYTKMEGGSPVGIEKTVRVRSDGSFEFDYEAPAKLDRKSIVGVELKGRTVFVMDAQAERPVAQCPAYGGGGRRCEFAFEAAEAFSTEAGSVMDAHYGKGEASAAELCSFVSDLAQAAEVAELRAAAGVEKEDVLSVLSGRLQVMMDRAASAGVDEAYDIYRSAHKLTCLSETQKTEVGGRMRAALEDRDVARARAALGKKEVAAALEILNGLLKVYPESVKGHFARAEVWVAYDQKGRAAEDLEAAARARPGDYDVRMHVAQFYALNGDYEKALGHFGAAMKASSAAAAPYEGAGRSLRGLGRLGEAAYAFEKGFGLDETLADLAVQGAILQEGLGNLEQAAALYARSYASDPKSETALLGWAGTLDRLGRSEEAVTHYEEGVQKQVFGVSGLVRAGRRLFEEKRPGTAKQALERALDLDAGNVEATVALSRIYVAEGFGKAARERLMAAAQRHPDDARAYKELGIVHLHEGDAGKAVAAFTQARSRSKDDPEIDTYLLIARVKSVGGRTKFSDHGFDTHLVEHLDQFFGHDVVMREITQRSGISEKDLRGMTLFQKTVVLGAVLVKDGSWLVLMPARVDDPDGKHGMVSRLKKLAGKTLK